MKKRFWLTIILLAILFYAAYAGFFYLFHDYLEGLYLATEPDPSVFAETGPPHPTNAHQTFSVFGAIMGLGYMAFGLVNAFFFWGIIAIFRAGKNIYARFAVLLFVYGVLLVIGAEMAFYEKSIYELSRSITYFMGYPLFFASTVTVAAIIVTGIVSFLIRKTDA